jgi:hypothetical protein
MKMRRILLNLTMVIALLWSVCSAGAKEEAKETVGKPDAEVSLEANRLTLGLGFTWGDGTLQFKGKNYKFKVSGLNLVGLGFTSVKAKGEVYNLENLEDFPGKYFGVEAGATLIKGSAGLLMKNTKGVVINLKAEQTGVELKMGNEGLNISAAWD